MMSKIHSILFAVFLINCSSISLNNSSYSFNDDLNESDIKRHIKYLSSDELEGRFPGTKGSELAIDYIASNFKNYKLAPFQDNSFDVVIATNTIHNLGVTLIGLNGL